MKTQCWEKNKNIIAGNSWISDQSPFEWKKIALVVLIMVFNGSWRKKYIYFSLIQKNKMCLQKDSINQSNVLLSFFHHRYQLQSRAYSVIDSSLLFVVSQTISFARFIYVNLKESFYFSQYILVIMILEEEAEKQEAIRGNQFLCQRIRCSSTETM